MAKKAGKLNLFLQLRFYTLVIAAWLLNLRFMGWSLRSVCSPGFNCHGCPWATMACPIGVFSFSSAIHVWPLLAIATILAVGLILGRIVCGFLCPFGLIQELLYRIPSPKIKLPSFTRWFKYVFLALLVVILPYFLGFYQSGYVDVPKPVIDKGEDGMLKVGAKVKNLGGESVKGVKLDAVFIDNETQKEVFRKQFSFPELTVKPGEEVTVPEILVPNHLATANLLVSSPESMVKQSPRYDLYFCSVCPAGTLTASIPGRLSAAASDDITETYAGGWWSFRYIVLYVFLALMILVCRPFCRMMCPLGAIYALTSPAAATRMTIDHDACINCGKCDKVCPVDLDVRKQVGGPECIACGDCAKVCPKKCITRKTIFSSCAGKTKIEEASRT